MAAPGDQVPCPTGKCRGFAALSRRGRGNRGLDEPTGYPGVRLGYAPRVDAQPRTPLGILGPPCSALREAGYVRAGRPYVDEVRHSIWMKAGLEMPVDIQGECMRWLALKDSSLE